VSEDFRPIKPLCGLLVAAFIALRALSVKALLILQKAIPVGLVRPPFPHPRGLAFVKRHLSSRFPLPPAALVPYSYSSNKRTPACRDVILKGAGEMCGFPPAVFFFTFQTAEREQSSLSIKSRLGAPLGQWSLVFRPRDFLTYLALLRGHPGKCLVSPPVRPHCGVVFQGPPFPPGRRLSSRYAYRTRRGALPLFGRRPGCFRA